MFDKHKSLPKIASVILLYFFSEELLFLIPKSHPNSQHPLVEWSISFSLVERRILSNIPEYQRTAYLILKQKMEFKVQRYKILSKSYKSYHLKTVLLELALSKHYCTVRIHNNAYEYSQNHWSKDLIEVCEKRYVPNFSLPSQNLFEDQNIELIFKTRTRWLL